MPSRTEEFLPVVCALICRGARLLVARRGPGSAREGLWEFPGGKLHTGESPAEGIVREMREELDLVVVPVKVLPAVVFIYPDLAVRLIPVICRRKRGAPVIREHTAVCFADPDRIPAPGLCAADAHLLAQLMEQGQMRYRDGKP